MPVSGSHEPLLSWRRLCLVLSCILSFVLIIYVAGSRLPHNPLVCAPHPSPVHEIATTRYGSTFGDPKLDTEVIDGLTTTECHAVFPDLFVELDRAVAYWKKLGHIITADDVSIDPDRVHVMRILIHNNILRVLESSEAFFVGFRSLGQIALLQRALDSATAAGETLPTIEFLINFADDADPAEGRTHSFWSTARNVTKQSHERIWLIPNFDFWWSPAPGAFEDAKRLAVQYDKIFFAEKIPKIVWRGNTLMNAELRGALLAVTDGKPWADVVNIDGSNNPGDRLEVFQYCRYAMTVYTEGITFSGRMKFLMNCASLLFVPDGVWVVHYDHLLKASGPEQNYVAVSRDWNDLEEKVQYYLAHPAEAERIIANMLATFRSRYTTRAATSCYIRQLVRAYKEVSFDPPAVYTIYDGEVLAARGVAYEKFRILPGDGNFDRLPYPL